MTTPTTVTSAQLLADAALTDFETILSEAQGELAAIYEMGPDAASWRYRPSLQRQVREARRKLHRFARDRVTGLLTSCGTYGPLQARLWLFVARHDLAGRTPMWLIANGEHRRVIKLAARLGVVD